jgi:ABC-type multidrug transport system ATPase subunit
MLLDHISGVLRPGTMTLILAPPGGGKSLLLRALAGRMAAGRGKPGGLSRDSGHVRYGGLTEEEARAQGVSLSKLASYMPQGDEHYAQLTVRETMEFAGHNLNCDPALIAKAGHGDAAVSDARNRVANVMSLLSLEGCADTRVGSGSIRGISGGEKRRLTLAEALVGSGRVLLLDSPSDGLDSSVTLAVLSSVREWTTATGATVCVALQQPTPETYALFDEVILLREGAELYHGPRTAMRGYLEDIGYVCPPGRAEADFAIEFLTNPSAALGSDKGSGVNGASSRRLRTPTTTTGLASAWRNSSLFERMMNAESSEGAADSALPVKAILESPFLQRQYGVGLVRSVASHFLSLLGRQMKLVLRDKTFLFARVAGCLIMGLILGSLFYRLERNEFNLKLGLAL